MVERPAHLGKPPFSELVARIRIWEAVVRIPWSPRGFDPSNRLVVGCAQGIGAMCGDAAKSFVKRRIGIAPRAVVDSGRPTRLHCRRAVVGVAMAQAAAARRRTDPCIHLRRAHRGQSRRVPPRDSRYIMVVSVDWSDRVVTQIQ